MRLQKVKYLILSVVLVSVFIMTACGQTKQQAPDAASPMEDAPAVESPIAVADAAQSPTAEPVPDDTSEPVAEMVAPTPRPEMAATDPSTVTLATGDVQLVEFFAYW